MITLRLLRSFRGLLDRRQPEFLVFAVTAGCSARCPFCFYASRVASAGREQELDIGEIEKISLRCGRIPYLLLSGGEPVLRDDLDRLIGLFIENSGAAYVTVPSNGLQPERTEKLFAGLVARHPSVHFRAAFSVDFPDARHDDARGVPGCLDGVVECALRIGRLRDRTPNLTMEAVSIYAPWNASVMPELREWVRTAIRPDNHELHLLRADWPSVLAEGLDSKAFLSELEQFRLHGRRAESRPLSPFFRSLNDAYAGCLGHLLSGAFCFPCRAGERIVTLDETGRVRLCEPREDVLGDLREEGYDLKRVLGSERARRIVCGMQRDRCRCTWECAVSTNIVFTPGMYPRLAAGTLRHALSRRKGRE